MGDFASVKIKAQSSKIQVEHARENMSANRHFTEFKNKNKKQKQKRIQAYLSKTLGGKYILNLNSSVFELLLD